MKKYSFYLIVLCLMLISCINDDAANNQEQILASDYRIFQGTIAWDLAKAMHQDDSVKIRQLVGKNKQLINFIDPKYGQTILALAVYNEKYNSAKTLVELGADPNAFNNCNGMTPLMEAADLNYYGGSTESRFLLLLLKYGGNPNTEQKYLRPGTGGGRTPLAIACVHGRLDLVRILISAGADINYKNDPKHGTLLQAAMISENPALVLYLIQHGIDYKQPTWIIDSHHKTYITDDLRSWTFDLGSEKYKEKMQIVTFLKNHGMDYWKTPVPSYYYESFDKAYLDKY